MQERAWSVKENTRGKSDTTHALNILDLILVLKEVAGISILYVFDVGPVANSDHTSTLFNIKCKLFIVSNKRCPQLPVASRFIFSKCNFEKAHCPFSNIDWNALLLLNLSIDILLHVLWTFVIM